MKPIRPVGLDPATVDAIVTAVAAATNAPPRLTVMPEEAAGMLGVSRDFFDAHVKPELRVVRRGRLLLIPVKELERWADRNAERVLG